MFTFRPVDEKECCTECNRPYSEPHNIWLAPCQACADCKHFTFCVACQEAVLTMPNCGKYSCDRHVGNHQESAMVTINNKPYGPIGFSEMRLDNFLALCKEQHWLFQPAKNLECNPVFLKVDNAYTILPGETAQDYCARLLTTNTVKRQDFPICHLFEKACPAQMTIAEAAEFKDTEKYVLLDPFGKEITDDKRLLFTYSALDFTCKTLTEHQADQARIAAQVRVRDERAVAPSAPVAQQKGQKRNWMGEEEEQEEDEEEEEDEQEENGGKRSKSKPIPWLQHHGLNGSSSWKKFEMVDSASGLYPNGAVCRLWGKTKRDQLVGLFKGQEMSDLSSRKVYVFLDFLKGTDRADALNRYKDLANYCGDHFTGKKEKRMFRNGMVFLVKMYAPRLSAEQRAAFVRDFKRFIEKEDEEEEEAVVVGSASEDEDEEEDEQVEQVESMDCSDDEQVTAVQATVDISQYQIGFSPGEDLFKEAMLQSLENCESDGRIPDFFD